MGPNMPLEFTKSLREQLWAALTAQLDMSGRSMTSSDEDLQSARQQLWISLTAQLSGERVFCPKQPGVSEVLLDMQALQVLEFVRCAESAVGPNHVAEAGLVSHSSAAALLNRLEQAGFLRHSRGERGNSSGFVCSTSSFTVAHLASREVLSIVAAHHAAVASHNSAHTKLAGDSATHSAQEPFLDRVVSLSENELIELRDAIFRVLQTCATIEENVEGKRSSDVVRRQFRVRVSLDEVEDFNAPLVPVHIVNLAGAGLSPRWVSRMGKLLTPRQQQIVLLVSEGAKRAAIAERLGISENTVKCTLRDIYQRLQVTSRAQLLVKLREACDLPLISR